MKNIDIIKLFDEINASNSNEKSLKIIIKEYYNIINELLVLSKDKSSVSLCENVKVFDNSKKLYMDSHNEICKISDDNIKEMECLNDITERILNR